MKNVIIDFLYWVLEKLERQKVTRMNVGVTTSIKLNKVVPANGKWHHIVMTVSAWVNVPMESDSKTLEVAEIGVWKNKVKIEDFGDSKPEVLFDLDSFTNINK